MDSSDKKQLTMEPNSKG